MAYVVSVSFRNTEFEELRLVAERQGKSYPRILKECFLGAYGDGVVQKLKEKRDLVEREIGLTEGGKRGMEEARDALERLRSGVEGEK